jgi:cell wall assembly regulator SMI1
MLGDLNVKQIENRLGIEFPDDIRELMLKTHQSKANNIERGKWHCFDIPFNLVCGDIELATKIFESVKDRSSECKEKLQFSLSNQE